MANAADTNFAERFAKEKKMRAILEHKEAVKKAVENGASLDELKPDSRDIPNSRNSMPKKKTPGKKLNFAEVLEHEASKRGR